MAFPTIRKTLQNALLVSFMFVGPLVAYAPASSAQTNEPEKLVTAAYVTLNNFVRDPDMNWFQLNLGLARGVLIAPHVVKAGFLTDGSGGRAILMVRDRKTGSWSGPAFYTLSPDIVGFQPGIAVSETALLVMTEEGLNSLLARSFKFGRDIWITAGPVGFEIQPDIRPGIQSAISADFISFSRSKGVYGGIDYEGAVIQPADDWNEAYYRAPSSSRDIVLLAKVSSSQSARLRATLEQAAKFVE